MTIYCDFVTHAGVARCENCGFAHPATTGKIYRHCNKDIDGKDLLSMSPAYKCGAELKALLSDWLSIESTPTCSCNAMARKMDTLGPDWAEGEGMAAILDVMRAEHAKRWADGRTILPWTDVGARQLVLLACRRSRAKAAG